jgi:pyruvate dehydrogenase complex dihydrolipoamide acetyltransferase long form
MPVELTIPKLGMTMKEATIARWIKGDGDPVKAGEVVLVIETEKITYEVEAPAEGFLQILEPAGAVLPVGARVGVLLAERTAASAAPPAPEAEPSQPVPPVSSPAHGGSGVVPPAPAASGRPKASPLARRIARDRGVDLARVSGTGPGGRIVQEDVLRYIERGPLPTPAEAGSALGAMAGKSVRAMHPVSGMRRQIFKHMHLSLQETAQITLTSEVDATELQRLRRSLIRRHEKDDVRISYNAILVRVVAQVLTEQPWVNASVDGDRVIHWADVHVGVAMELDEGLIVPVVRNADRRTVLDIERTLQELFQRARGRKLLPDDIQGGTFTISNLGHLGIDAFTPILNRPESGILGVGRMTERPVAVRRDGRPEVEIRQRMVLSLTVDHRVVDGAPGARFLRRIAEFIEDPYLMIS